MNIKDLSFKKFISKTKVQQKVTELAEQISQDYVRIGSYQTYQDPEQDLIC